MGLVEPRLGVAPRPAAYETDALLLSYPGGKAWKHEAPLGGRGLWGIERDGVVYFLRRFRRAACSAFCLEKASVPSATRFW